jgi:hypothetical protein
MPRRLTRPEVTNRLAIRALHDARPKTTQLQLAALFHVSLRTVNQAIQHPLQDWATALAAAPPAKKPAASSIPRSRLKRQYLLNPAGPVRPSLGPGNRALLKPVRMDDQGDGFDPDLPEDRWQEQSDEGLEAERDRQAKDAEDGT